MFSSLRDKLTATGATVTKWYNKTTFRRLVRNGNEEGALELYNNNSSDLQVSCLSNVCFVKKRLCLE